MSLLPGAKDLPGWLQQALLPDRINGSAVLNVGGSRVELPSFSAKSSKVDVKGRYRKVEADHMGKFLFSSGPLAVGLEVANGHTDLVMTDLQSWFAR